MRSDTTFCTFPADPVACTVNALWNQQVGLPMSTPAAVSVKPFGGVPPLTDHVHVEPQSGGLVVSV